jgi:hypothetical protein
MFVGNVGYEVCRYSLECGAVGVASVQVSWEFLGPNYLADRLYLVFDHLILIYDLLRK